jgi:hypothetical protein
VIASKIKIKEQRLRVLVHTMRTNKIEAAYQEPYCEFAGTEVLKHKLRVNIVVPEAGCCVQPAK